MLQRRQNQVDTLRFAGSESHDSSRCFLTVGVLARGRFDYRGQIDSRT